MNSNGFKLIVVVTALAVVAAIFTLNRSSDASPASEDRGPLFEGLMERVNDVARIEVTRGEESFAVARDGETWGLESRGGFPVKFETVKQLIVGLANLEIVERKTKNPSNFDKLGLGDYTDPEGAAKLVTLRDGGGAVLASAVIGNTKFGGNTPSLYVRRDGEEQTWRCRGKLQVTDQPLSWVEKKIVQIERDRIADARIEHGDGEVVTATRAAKDETNWSLVETPPGRDLSSPSVMSAIATWPTYLSFDDVAPADTVEFAGGTAYECRTFDGLVVRVETTSEGSEGEEKTWARFSARYEEPVEVGPELPEVPEEGAEGDDLENALAGLETESGPSPDVVRAEVAALNAELERWVYALPSYKVTQLEKRVTDLLAPLPEPEPEPEPEQEGEAEGSAVEVEAGE